MGSTDKGNFTKIPNEILEAVLRQPLRITQLKAVLYIIRKTYGYQKQDDRISISMMAREAGCSRRAMVNAIHDLIKMGIVKVGPSGSGQVKSMMITDIKFWDRDAY